MSTKMGKIIMTLVVTLPCLCVSIMSVLICVRFSVFLSVCAC